MHQDFNRVTPYRTVNGASVRAMPVCLIVFASKSACTDERVGGGTQIAAQREEPVPAKAGIKICGTQILGWGKPRVQLRRSTERALAMSGTSAAPPRNLLACARRFRPSLKGRVDARHYEFFTKP